MKHSLTLISLALGLAGCASATPGAFIRDADIKDGRFHITISPGAREPDRNENTLTQNFLAKNCPGGHQTESRRPILIGGIGPDLYIIHVEGSCRS